jgi:hypothetical protein
METSGQIDVKQGVELADVRAQSDPSTVGKRAGDGDRPGDVRRSVGIDHGRCEAAGKFVRRSVGVDRAPSHAAGYQQTSTQVDEGRGDVRATYLQCPDELKRLGYGATIHRTYAFTTRTCFGPQAFTM